MRESSSRKTLKPKRVRPWPMLLGLVLRPSGERSAETRAEGPKGSSASARPWGRLRRSAGLAALCAIGLVVGCQRDDGEYPQWWTFPADERIWESEHFIYHSYPDDDATCPEVLNILEQHFQKSQEYLGFPWPKGAKIDYYKFPDFDELSKSQACYGTACASYGLVFSVDRVEAHELVHSYFLVEGAQLHPLVDEGLAEASACNNAGAPFPANLLPWRDLVAGIGRDEAGKWFVAYLLSRYPVSQFTEWFRSTRYGMTADEFGRSFEAVYGVSLDDVWEELPSIAIERFPCPLAPHCAGPPLPLDGSSTDLFFCGEGSASRSFLVTEPTTLILQANLPFLATGLMECAWPDFGVTSLQHGVSHGNDVTVVNVEPGFYGFGVYLYKQSMETQPVFEDAPLYRTKPYRVQAHLSSKPILAPTCEDAAPFEWSETGLDRAWATWTIPTGEEGAVQYARLIPGEGYHILVDKNVPDVSLSLCDGCEGECIPAKDHNSMLADADGVVTLRFERTKAGGEVAPSVAWLPVEE